MAKWLGDNRGCVLFGRAAVWRSEAPVRPGQCIAPAIQDSQAESAIARSAAATCFGRERLRLNREASLRECLGCSAARQQSVWSIGNAVCHRVTINAGPVPAR
jgi:hypothetical protein